MSYHVHDYFTSGPDIVGEINPTTRIFVVCVWEALVPDQEFLARFYSKPNPITLVLNSWAKHIPIDKRFDVFYIDFFLWRTYNEIVNKQKSFVNNSWNAESKQFLFLTGKPEKEHRIGLLYSLEQQGLTSRCVSSLFINELNQDTCRQILGVDDKEFQRFVNKFNNSPDFVGLPTAASVHYGGIPYNVNLFQTKFRLISETHINSASPWITEKTWITILNQQPFLIAGDVRTCRKLNSFGYKTFDSALCCVYDTVANWPQRKTALLKNVEQWLDTEYNFSADVKHNYNTLIQQAKNNLTNWNNYCKSIGVEIDIDSVIDTTDPQPATI